MTLFSELDSSQRKPPVFSTAGVLFRCFDLCMHKEEKQSRESWPWGKEAEPGSKAETVARSVFLPSDTAL